MKKVYKLKFETPCHFGAAELGGKLESVSFSYASDVLFGALCCELVSNEKVCAFVEAVNDGKILFTDLLPYKDEKFFLPKPILLVDGDKAPARLDLGEMRRQATQRKKQKKIEFIRASRFAEYFCAVKTNAPFSEENRFGETTLLQKVSCREEEPLPYFLGAFSFYEDSGFYVVALFDDEANVNFFENILQSLGLSGIGGKKSSGLGKFSLNKVIPLDDGTNDDLCALNQMLADENSAWQMNLSSLIPAADEVATLKQSFFKLKRRGGFVSSHGTGYVKKDNVCVATAGSCFPTRLKGTLVSLGNVDGHEIFRLGKAVYAGLTI